MEAILPEQKKKRSAGRVILKALLWLVLTPVLLALLVCGALYAYLTLCGFAYDENPRHYLNLTPAATAERLTAVSPPGADAVALTLSLDKNDLWWVIEREDLLSPLLDDAEALLAPYDLALSAYGFTLEDGHLYVSARLTWRGFLGIPVRAELLPDVENRRDPLTDTRRYNQLVLRVGDVWIGRAFKAPLARLGLVTGPESEPVYALGKVFHPRQYGLTAAAVSGDRLALTFRYTMEELFEQTANSGMFADERGYYTPSLPAARISLAMRRDGAAATAAFNEAVTACAADPMQLVRLKREALALAANNIAEQFYIAQTPRAAGAKDTAYLDRFFPELSEKNTVADRAALDAAAEAGRAALDTLVRRLQALYTGGALTIAADSLQYEGQGLLLSNAAENWAQLAPWLDETQARVLLLDGFNDGEPVYPAETAGLPALADVPRTDDAVIDGLKRREPCPIGLALTMANGARKLAYVAEGGSVALIDLAEETFQAALSSETLPRFASLPVFALEDAA